MIIVHSVIITQSLLGNTIALAPQFDITILMMNNLTTRNMLQLQGYEERLQLICYRQLANEYKRKFAGQKQSNSL
jgi:hypothetical protein